MSRPTAQIVIYLDPDTQEYHAEIPTANGSRRKVDLPEKLQKQLFNSVIGDELTGLDIWLRDQEQTKVAQERDAQMRAKEAKDNFNLALHRKVWDTSATTKGQGKEFANDKFGSRKDPRVPVPNVMKFLRQQAQDKSS
jgi:hypothetical protein